ncbi:MAG: hypothetical protein IJ300_07630 [Clostridia bacterium]|nr:hypothetical protein [Clostridia bacterium]
MFKTLVSDRETIERKYHNPDEEFDSDRRFTYHGYDYDPSTGMNETDLKKGLEEYTAKLEGEPHPIHKARLFEYVLDNTMIDVNEHDYFIGIYSWGRLISWHTVFKWRDKVRNSFPEATETLAKLNNSGATYGWLDFEHTVPDWDSLLELGFTGILNRARDSYEKLKASGTLTQKQEYFYRGIEIEYKAIIRFIDRLYNYALTKNFDKAPQIVACLKNLRDGAPQNSYDALQMIYIYFMLSESVDHYQVRSLGYGLDGSLYPFFKKDIENGIYTKEEIGEFIGYFLMQWYAIGNYWGQPFYLGGTNLDGTTKVNELSSFILEVYDELGLHNPKIQIKYSKSTPKDFIIQALEMIRHGVSSIVFCNEDVAVKALMSKGATYEEALDHFISGCYEYGVKAKCIGMDTAYINTLKPVSLVLDNGFDVVSGEQVGLKTGNPEEFTSFKEFYDAYIKQLKYCLNTHIDAAYYHESRIAEINPSLMFSATIPDCVNSLTDALDCGIQNDCCVTVNGLGTAVDALMAIYELVFEKKITTIKELKAALANNWNGYMELRAKALNATHKYGVNDAVADNYALAIEMAISELARSKVNAHGGRWGVEMHSARAFIIHGEKTAATPDGRKYGEETSKNASPTPGADTKGITGLINSATTLNTTIADVGFCLDAMLHPSAVQGDDGMDALYAVLDTYMKKGGASIHFNIFNPDMLREAQKNPEKYKTLQVRVCGWNILWNDMPKKEQDAYILRAERII